MKKKTLLLVIGIIFLIGLLLTACGNGANGDTNVFEGKWVFTETNMTGTYSNELTFSGNTYRWEIYKTTPTPVSYCEGSKGTFTYNATTITFNITHESFNGIDWVSSPDSGTINYQISGENLIFDYGDGDTDIFIKAD